MGKKGEVVWGKSVPGRGNSKCEAPEALLWLEDQQGGQGGYGALSGKERPGKRLEGARRAAPKKAQSLPEVTAGDRGQHRGSRPAVGLSFCRESFHVSVSTRAPREAWRTPGRVCPGAGLAWTLRGGSGTFPAPGPQGATDTRRACWPAPRAQAACAEGARGCG